MSSRSFPRSDRALAAADERRTRSSPSTRVSVIPLPVTRQADSSNRMGRLAVTRRQCGGGRAAMSTFIPRYECASHAGSEAPAQPSQLPHSSAVSGGTWPFDRSSQRTTSQPRCRATAWKASLGFTTTGFPTASKSGVSAWESE